MAIIYIISEENMNPTVELLRLLGSPFGPSQAAALNRVKLMRLYYYSCKNRMSFFYLDTIRRNNLGDFSATYENENIRHLKTDDSIARASSILRNAHIDHAVFKTIRPYKSTTVDIDIIILGDGKYAESVKAMQTEGYKLVVRGPRSTTMLDQETNIGVDLYNQVAVSLITYIDKRKLIDYVTNMKLLNGRYVKTLKPEADLACIIAHSIIKEQMYTLSEYYTFIHYLKRMDISNFVQMVKENNIVSATRTHTAITALLHQAAHKTIPNELRQILECLGQENLETARIQKRNFKTPHKYHPITIAKSLLEIAKGKETRKSMATQLASMIYPSTSKDFFKKLVDHTFRETY